MISERTLRFSDLGHLERTFADRVASNAAGSQIAVMGGHFMLAYDETVDRLVPMIWQDAENERVKALSRRMAGDFPLRSMELSLSLANLAHDRAATPRIILLVNDHKFTDRTFDPQVPEGVVGRAEGLRKDFFRHNRDLPPALGALARRAPIPLNELILSNDDSRRDGNAILPKSSIFFSEMALRNRFNHQSRQYVKTDPHFRLCRRVNARGVDGGGYDVFYRDGRNREKCLTEDAGCGCSGEMVEFFLQLGDRGFDRIVTLVPDECELPVQIAGRIAAELLAERRSSPGLLWVVTGIGGAGHLPGEESHEVLTALEITWPAR